MCPQRTVLLAGASLNSRYKEGFFGEDGFNEFAECSVTSVDCADVLNLLFDVIRCVRGASAASHGSQNNGYPFIT